MSRARSEHSLDLHRCAHDGHCYQYQHQVRADLQSTYRVPLTNFVSSPFLKLRVLLVLTGTMFLKVVCLYIW